MRCRRVSLIPSDWYPVHVDQALSLSRIGRWLICAVFFCQWMGGSLRSEDFSGAVAPVLIRHCLDCHNAAERKGGLDLTSRLEAESGGDSGPVIVPRHPDESPLWRRVRDDEMPPEKRISAVEKEVLRKWIASGAAWDGDSIDPYQITTESRAGYDWWALQPVRDPALSDLNFRPDSNDRPSVNDRARNPLDSLVHARLDAAGLTPSQPASRRALIRRLSFDLTGLSPTPDQVRAFRRDGAPDAYERLVDRLLASPTLGIRWGRHWLDVVRFGESQGFERDKLRENAWPYRDWVINALNQDMPYDEFTELQLAGDVLRPGDGDALVATGFLVAGPWDEVGQKQQSLAMRAVVREDELEDLIAVVGQTFLGLTINCARCHDHKFDPVSQKEYYQLAAALAGVRHGERDRPSQTDSPAKPNSPAGEQKPVAQKVYAVSPRKPAATHVLQRGNPAMQREMVPPGGVAAVSWERASARRREAGFGLAPDAPDAPRRVKLAQWITNEANPLFGRVIVNRLWHYHFGTGLVETPSDLGFNGGRPSHPKLIDHLAVAIHQSNWRLKPVHRLIVTSATYRQSSRWRDGPASVDADNRLLWRKTPRRLEAEAIRDTMLQIASQLNQQMGGPGYRDFTTFVRNTQFYSLQDVASPATSRRGVYRTWVRSGRNGFLDAFDCPDPSTKTPRRAVTITPLQALTLMNNSFVLRMSDEMAKRIQRESGDEESNQVRLVYELAYARAPQDEEIALAQKFVVEHGLAAFCRVVLNSNEFLYID